MLYRNFIKDDGIRLQSTEKQNELYTGSNCQVVCNKFMSNLIWSPKQQPPDSTDNAVAGIILWCSQQMAPHYFLQYMLIVSNCIYLLNYACNRVHNLERLYSSTYSNSKQDV